jgi:hypothetical protein
MSALSAQITETLNALIQACKTLMQKVGAEKPVFIAAGKDVEGHVVEMIEIVKDAGDQTMMDKALDIKKCCEWMIRECVIMKNNPSGKTLEERQALSQKIISQLKITFQNLSVATKNYLKRCAASSSSELTTSMETGQRSEGSEEDSAFRSNELRQDSRNDAYDNAYGNNNTAATLSRNNSYKEDEDDGYNQNNNNNERNYSSNERLYNNDRISSERSYSNESLRGYNNSERSFTPERSYANSERTFSDNPERKYNTITVAQTKQFNTYRTNSPTRSLSESGDHYASFHAHHSPSQSPHSDPEEATSDPESTGTQSAPDANTRERTLSPRSRDMQQVLANRALMPNRPSRAVSQQVMTPQPPNHSRQLSNRQLTGPERSELTRSGMFE